MERFRQDNTQGYSDSELAELNTAFDKIVDGDELEKSELDHIAEKLLFYYDVGLRSDDLVGAITS